MEVRGHLKTPPPDEDTPVRIGKEAGWTRLSGCCGQEALLLLLPGVE